SLACPMTNALNPPTLSERALKPAAGTYSLPNAARVLSLTNGTVAAANFSVEAIGGGEGVGGAGGEDVAALAACAGAAVDAGAGAAGGAGLTLFAGASTLATCVSSLVK